MHVDYLAEEISSWRAGQLVNLAVNSRFLVNGHVMRQQWDVFDRSGDALSAYRLQGKTLDGFRREHPGFVAHWDPARFGQPWLQDYPLANPERRTDLDLPVTTAGPDLRSPLALAFYWTRRIPRPGETVEVVLPGFKQAKTADLTIAQAGPSGDGGSLWEASVLYPPLRTPHPSTAKAWISADGHLSQLAFSVWGRTRSANGLITAAGCTATAAAGR